MPTATSISGYSLTNNGPLTTTFTAPLSCSTPFDILLGYATEPTHFQWQAQCDFMPPADCNPSGSAIRSIVSSAGGSNPTADMILVYHSPGLVCPSGWSTVGAAAKLNPTSTSISGAFNQSDTIPTGSNLGSFEPELDVFLAALDYGETAIVCCPRFAPLPPTHHLMLISVNGTGANVISPVLTQQSMALATLHSRARSSLRLAAVNAATLTATWEPSSAHGPSADRRSLGLLTQSREPHHYQQ